MNRLFVSISAVLLIGSAAYITNQSEAGPADPPQPPPPPPPMAVVFNMPMVMKEFEKAKDCVAKLNEKRAAMSSGLIKLRAEQKAAKDIDQKDLTAKEKAAIDKKVLDLTRQIDDREREITNALNDEASEIIAKLYDDIKSVVDKLAKTNRYYIVFTYPAETTPEDAKNSYFKEMKLKPTAALPFYVAPKADITAAVIAAVNEQFPVIRPVTGP